MAKRPVMSVAELAESQEAHDPVGKPERELRVAAAEGRFEDEGWCLRKDGSRFWANVVITAVRDAEGRLRGFAKVTRDLTERRKQDESLRDITFRSLITHAMSDWVENWNAEDE